MGKFCLENYFVLELYSVGGCPLERTSELGFEIIKVSFWNQLFIVLSIFLFLMIFL
jgi:hypothetical protein